MNIQSNTIIKRIKKLYNSHKELILYMFFGGLTTLVNLISYLVITRLVLQNFLKVDFDNYFAMSTAISWFFSVLFAYITNRKYVFNSNSDTFKEISIEIIKFFSCRIFSGIIDILLMLLLINIFFINDLISRVICNILVIVINYIFSKLLIFKSFSK